MKSYDRLLHPNQWELLILPGKLGVLLLTLWIGFSAIGYASIWAQSNREENDPGKLPVFVGILGEHPAGWKSIQFQKIERTTHYELTQDGKRTALRATADRSASGLVWEHNFNPLETPILGWDWKISGVLAKGDGAKKSGDDFPARVLVLFPYDPDTASAWDKVKFNLAKAFYGEYPPAMVITYIWANKLPKEQWATSTYTERVRLFPVESGVEHAGIWRKARRDIAVDFQAAFPNAQLPSQARLAVMVDTDNTEDQTETWFANFQLIGK